MSWEPKELMFWPVGDADGYICKGPHPFSNSILSFMMTMSERNCQHGVMVLFLIRVRALGISNSNNIDSIDISVSGLGLQYALGRFEPTLLMLTACSSEADSSILLQSSL